jgi:hypothetical protein
MQQALSSLEDRLAPAEEIFVVVAIFVGRLALLVAD